MTNRTRLLWVVALTFVASLAPDVVLRETVGSLPVWWLYAKATLLGVAPVFARDRVVDAFGRVLAVVVVMQGLMLEIGGGAWWSARFPPGTFATDFGGPIALKLLTAIPIVAILLFVTRSPRAALLTPGDLRVKASRIGWLSIPGDTITWGRLAVLAGLVIGLGTLLLTMLTATGFALPSNVARLLPLLPLIVVLALANSFAEGVAYRNAVLGPLRDALPKGSVLLLSAAFFGVAHYYSVPSGVIGVVMSSVLGWFLARAMFETRGFLAPWIIHFLQDVVIFSTIVLLGGY